MAKTTLPYVHELEAQLGLQSASAPPKVRIDGNPIEVTDITLRAGQSGYTNAVVGIEGSVAVKALAAFIPQIRANDELTDEIGSVFSAMLKKHPEVTAGNQTICGEFVLELLAAVYSEMMAEKKPWVD